MGRALPAARQGQKREGARCRRSAVAHASLRLPAAGCQSDGRQALVGGGEGRQGRQLVPYSLWIRVKSASSASVACTRSSFFNSKNKTLLPMRCKLVRPQERGSGRTTAAMPVCVPAAPVPALCRKAQGQCASPDRVEEAVPGRQARAHFHHSACQLQHPDPSFFLSAVCCLATGAHRGRGPHRPAGLCARLFAMQPAGGAHCPSHPPALAGRLHKPPCQPQTAGRRHSTYRPQAGPEPRRPPVPARPPHQCKEHVQSRCPRMPETLPWTRMTGRC